MSRITVEMVNGRKGEFEDNIAYCVAMAERVGLVESAMRWYNQAHSVAAMLAVMFNVPVEVVVAVIAILSPMIYWTENLIDAYELLSGNDEHKFSAYGHNVSKAYQALHTSDASLASSVKVRNFYLSILRPENPDSVTVDIHTLRALTNDYLSDRKELYKLFNTSGKQAIIIDVIKSEAVKYNMTGSQLQSLLWTVAQYRQDRKRDTRQHPALEIWERFVDSLPND